MTRKFNNFGGLLQEISDLHYISSLLGWDQQTYMPPGGAEARGNQLALVGRLAHERGTSPELGKLLEELKPYWRRRSSRISDDARLIKVTARDYEKATGYLPVTSLNLPKPLRWPNRPGWKPGRSRISPFSDRILRKLWPCARNTPPSSRILNIHTMPYWMILSRV